MGFEPSISRQLGPEVKASLFLLSREAAMKRYEERIDRVETRITARLRDQVYTNLHC